MKTNHPDEETIKKIFTESKTIAVVGLSDNPERTSYKISKYMQDYGFKIIPVNPMISDVLGEKAYPTLADIKEPVDIVNVFRRSEYLKEIAAEAKAINPKVFWAQKGVYDESIHQDYGDHFRVIMDLCIYVAYNEVM